MLLCGNLMPLQTIPLTIAKKQQQHNKIKLEPGIDTILVECDKDDDKIT